jgi:hypothetical protein
VSSESLRGPGRSKPDAMAIRAASARCLLEIARPRIIDCTTSPPEYQG